MRRRVLAVAAAATLILVGCQAPAPDPAMPRHHRPQTPSLVAPAPPPPQPDFSGYAEVSADDYVVTDQYSMYVSFKTPDGLDCRIGGIIGCDGALRGTPAPANEVELFGHPQAAVEVEPDGFRQTSNPQFAAPAGSSPKTLPVGHKIVYGDFQCAVKVGAVTFCSRGLPPASWFVLSPGRSAMGPRSPNLPARFPDPHDFVIDDRDYGVGSGRTRMFPYFSVASGLTCKIEIFSGGVFGCDGPLPGAPQDENEIYVDLSGRKVGMRAAQSPRFTSPNASGAIRRLTAQRRLDYTYQTYTTCMATADGGVACVADNSGHLEGFVVSAHSAWTFGG
jgi:hypothetical protein